MLSYVSFPRSFQVEITRSSTICAVIVGQSKCLIRKSERNSIHSLQIYPQSAYARHVRLDGAFGVGIVGDHYTAAALG